MEIKLYIFFIEDRILNLKVGDSIFLSGMIYLVRDVVYKRLIELLD